MPPARKPKPGPKTAPKAAPKTAPLTAETATATAASNGTPDPITTAIKGRMAEIMEAQQPTRDEIARLQATLSDGQVELDRLQTALDALEGKPVVTEPAAKRAAVKRGPRSSSGVPAEERAAKVLEFVTANPGTTNVAIAEHLEVANGTASKVVYELLESGQIRAEGERASRKLFVGKA